MFEPDLCKRCGQCCYYGQKLDKKCPNLYLKDGLTWCKIYDHRLGTIVGKEHNICWFCGLRKDTANDFVGCPYNTDKPIKHVAMNQD